MIAHDVCETCRCLPCECPPEPQTEPVARRRRPPGKVIGAPLSVTFTPEQAAWLQAQRAPGEPLTAVVRKCVQAIIDGAAPPCATKHCHRRKK